MAHRAEGHVMLHLIQVQTVLTVKSLDLLRKAQCLITDRPSQQDSHFLSISNTGCSNIDYGRLWDHG